MLVLMAPHGVESQRRGTDEYLHRHSKSLLDQAQRVHGQGTWVVLKEKEGLVRYRDCRFASDAQLAESLSCFWCR